ncbi:MAG TPA: branched-chain amino acid ABC transporter permease [Dehalococcoidia bacterium]|nr:branched-chain amino acid ABC transporter permease [Dehalococcoidia bacterium]
MTFLQVLVNAIALAAVYSLLGLGFVIIFKSMNVLSFAQPALMLWGGWWVVYFATIANWNFYLAVVIAVVIAAITGLVVERLFLRPMVGKSIFAVAIMTIGIDLVVRTISGNFYDVTVRSTGDPWGLNTLNLGGILINHRRIAALVVAIALVIALLAFFRFSRMGLAMRAAAFDQEVALIQGVSVGAVFALSWAMASVLATMAGLFMSPDTGSLTASMYPLALKALPVVVIGGLDSIGGTLLAALLVGFFESVTNTYQPTYAAFLGRNLSQVVPYVVMFIVLLIRPYGFFGTKEVERV